MMLSAPTMAQYGAIEGLRFCIQDVENMKNEYNQWRKHLFDSLKRISFECFEVKGAFYLFSNIKKFGYHQENFAWSSWKNTIF